MASAAVTGTPSSITGTCVRSKDMEHATGSVATRKPMSRTILLSALLAAMAALPSAVGFAPTPRRPAVPRLNPTRMARHAKPPQPLSDDVRVDAESALTNVGWSLPQEGDLTSDDPFVQAIDQGIQRDFGVPLDELLNPAKVVNLERDLYQLRTQLAELTGANATDLTVPGTPVIGLTTEQCDAGGGGEAADALRNKIRKKEKDLLIERRSVFRGWLKNVFLGQAILSFGLSYVMATQPEVLFGNYAWFYSYNMDISIKVLGYWWWWLFVVPSLRSRRPKGLEKKALDIAFVGTPLVSLVAPALTRDTGVIWALNLAVVAASYGFAFVAQDNGDDNDDDSQQPEWLKFVFKSLDFGSGRERGARK